MTFVKFRQAGKFVFQDLKIDFLHAILLLGLPFENMSAETIKIVITAALVLHGIAHARAFIALLAQSLGNLPATWLPVRSWLFPSMSSKLVAGVASLFWLLSTLGFLAAALSFWGILIPPDVWSQVIVPAAIISTLGTIFISGIWPGAPDRRLSTLDTIISLVINFVILVAQVGLHWPPA